MARRERWIDADELLREASRREDQWFDGLREEVNYNLPQAEVETIRELMGDITAPLGEKHSSGYNRFTSNDIKERGTDSEPALEGFPTPGAPLIIPHKSNNR